MKEVAEYPIPAVTLPSIAGMCFPGGLRVLSIHVDERLPMASFEIDSEKPAESWTFRAMAGEEEAPAPFVQLSVCTDLQGSALFSLWGHRYAISENPA